VKSEEWIDEACKKMHGLTLPSQTTPLMTDGRDSSECMFLRVLVQQSNFLLLFSLYWWFSDIEVSVWFHATEIRKIVVVLNFCKIQYREVYRW